LLLALTVSAGCNSTPSAPTPIAPPPPPVAEPPSLTCPAAITVAALASTGTAVTYATPEIRNGQGSVSVTCTPSSGATFPIGVTETQCVATDALNRTGSCTFSVTVSAPRLQRTRIMAFGDSLTAGATVLSNNQYDVVTLPDIAYPAVLSQLLSARYTAQTISVFNRGLGGEEAFRALPRFIGTFATDVPDVVVLQEGYNDFHRAPTDVIGIANVEIGIRDLASEARRRGARVFICTLAPGRAGRGQIPNSALLEINERLRNVARNEGAVLVDVYSALVTDVNANVSIDGLHLTAAGYRKVAETVFAAIRTELEIR
jgi:lysophospholipase L1-like esterase